MVSQIVMLKWLIHLRWNQTFLIEKKKTVDAVKLVFGL